MHSAAFRNCFASVYEFVFFFWAFVHEIDTTTLVASGRSFEGFGKWPVPSQVSGCACDFAMFSFSEYMSTGMCSPFSESDVHYFEFTGQQI